MLENSFPVRSKGKPVLETCQEVYFVELGGPLERTVTVYV
jgi:thiamine phosphate synthase YjbQ (UPF0047 family)